MRATLLLGIVGLTATVIARLSPIKRHEDGDCSPNPPGVPGYVNNPDTADTFLNNPQYSNAANGVATPSGYSEVFQNLHAAIIDNSAYLGHDSIQSYDPSYCAQRCNTAWPGCSSFDIYFERDATVDPGVNCTNPPSLTYISCAYYSACETQATATNVGQYCQDFHHVIAGSNLYTLNNNCSASSSTTTTTAATTSSVSMSTTLSKVRTTSSKNASTTPVITTTAKTTAVVTTTVKTTPSVTTTAKTTPIITTTVKTTRVVTTTAKTTSSSPAPKCSACSNGPFTDSNGEKYTVSCNTNLHGHDLGPVAASCYQDCFNICDKNPQCNAFSWDSTTPTISCWPKKVPTDGSAKPYAENGVVYAQMAPACSACVPGPFTDDNDQTYSVSCNTNHYGNDLGPVAASCYEDCFDICDKNPQCNAFSWDPTTPTVSCWPKNIPEGSPQTYSENGVVFAQMTPACSACASGQTTDSSGQVWQVTCASNFWGSDICQETASCYDDCFSLCDNNSQCNAFVFNAPSNTCWLKNIPSNGQAPQLHTESDTTFATMINQQWSSWGSGSQPSYPGSQGPAPGPQGPAPGSQGPSPGPQGPSPGPQGPAPGSQGPSPGSQGPAPGSQGPSPGSQGPPSSPASSSGSSGSWPSWSWSWGSSSNQPSSSNSNSNSNSWNFW